MDQKAVLQKTAGQPKLTYNEVLEKRRVKLGLDDKTIELFKEFDKFNIMRGISERRRKNYLYYLPILANLMKPKTFDKAVKVDYKELVYRIEKEKKWGDRVKGDFKVALKTFVKWLKGDEDSNVAPSEIAWVRSGIKYKIKPPDELLTDLEIKKLIKTAKNPRDKALISVAWEGGFRTVELLGIKIKDMTYTDDGIRIGVEGKTPRRDVLLIASAPLIANYLEFHPFRDDPNAPLWLIVSKIQNKEEKKQKYYALNDQSLLKILHDIFKRAEIKKKPHVYLFRHTRATQLATKLKDAQLRQYMGWTMHSDMPSVYISLSGRDLDSTIMEMHGLKESETFKEKLSIKVCERCHFKNSPERERCEQCTAPLDLSVAMEDQQKKDQTLETIIEKMVSQKMEQRLEILRGIREKR